MDEVRWLDQYDDIGDFRRIQFAVTCPNCHARYETVPQVPVADPVVEARVVFETFDAAYREMVCACPRCHAITCAQCWDAAHQLCTRCVAQSGQVPSGMAVAGPLASGRLRLAPRGARRTPPDSQWRRALRRLREVSGPVLARFPGQARHASLEPMSGFGDHLADGPGIEDYPAEVDWQEGRLTCPTCGALNYDFVSACHECGATLLRFCLRCGALNPGNADCCARCGRTLNVVEQAVTLERPANYFSASEVRTKIYHMQIVDGAERVERLATRSLPRGRHRWLSISRLGLRHKQVAVTEHIDAGALNESTLKSPSSGRRQGTARLVVILARISRSTSVMVWLVVVPVCIGVLAASELSPTVNDLVRMVLHIDIRSGVSQIVDALRAYWNFVRK